MVRGHKIQIKQWRSRVTDQSQSTGARPSARAEEIRRQIAEGEAREAKRIAELTYRKLAEPVDYITWDIRSDGGGGAIIPRCVGRSSMKVGSLAKVRPADPKYGDKTYLGLFIGEVALGSSARYADVRAGETKVVIPGKDMEPDTNSPSGEDGKALVIQWGHYNPAFLVPALGEVIYGAGSWWSPISKPEELRDITDEQIGDVWYVKALNEMAERAERKTDMAVKRGPVLEDGVYKVYRTDENQYVVADAAGWIPGVWATAETALAGGKSHVGDVMKDGKRISG
jgi:hypothetical protein